MSLSPISQWRELARSGLWSNNPALVQLLGSARCWPLAAAWSMRWAWRSPRCW